LTNIRHINPDNCAATRTRHRSDDADRHRLTLSQQPAPRIPKRHMRTPKPYKIDNGHDAPATPTILPV